MEKWFVTMKKADFNGIAEKYQISPIIARLMRNRDVIGDEAIDFYLNGTVEDLYDGLLMKDMDRAVDILKEKIEEGKKIRVIGDYESMQRIFCNRGLQDLGQMWIRIFRTGSKMDMD